MPGPLLHWRDWYTPVNRTACGRSMRAVKLTLLGRHATCPECIEAWKSAEVAQALAEEPDDPEPFF